MAENLPELAIDDDFSSEALEPDEEGVYTVVEYRRKDRTLYMRSTLSSPVGEGIYGVITLAYYDRSGTIPLHHVSWELQYDIRGKIVSKRMR